MSRLRETFKYDRDAPGVVAEPGQTAELRRVANLFLVSAITLLLFVLRAIADALAVTFIPDQVYVVWGVVLVAGWAATWIYGTYVSAKARSWGWFVLCVIPLTCVPCAAAYAWVRRGEIEREVLGESSTRRRQPRGGRTRSR